MKLECHGVEILSINKACYFQKPIDLFMFCFVNKLPFCLIFRARLIFMNIMNSLFAPHMFICVIGRGPGQVSHTHMQHYLAKGEISLTPSTKHISMGGAIYTILLKPQG